MNRLIRGRWKLETGFLIPRNVKYQYHKHKEQTSERRNLLTKESKPADMTKPLVQGQIGYWADGKLVYMPKRSQPPAKTLKIVCEEAHTKRNRERKEAVAFQRRQRDKNLSSGLKSNTPQRFVEDLRNASKNGNIALVWVHLKRLRNDIDNRYKGPSPCFFQLLMRFVFEPDREDRTALYYASLTGHHHLVELYMSIYVMSIQITEGTVVAAYTFRDWFSSMSGTRKLGLSKKFTLGDYDLCVLNSLNEHVRHVLTRKKVTLSDIINTVEKSLDYGSNFGMSVTNARITVIKNDIKRMKHVLKLRRKKIRKPMLNNDTFDGGCESDNSDFLVEEEDVASNTEQNQHDDRVITIDNQVTGAAQELLPILIIDDQHFEREDFVEDLDSISDFTVLQDAISIGYSHVSMEKLCADDDEGTSQGWDMVSDLMSVKSVDTLMTNKSIETIPLSTTYKDMLLKAAKSDISCNGVANNVTEPTAILPTVNEDVKSVDKTMPSIAEEVIDNDVMYDAHWERDGFKNGRGGKLGKLFKGNTKSVGIRSYSWQYDASAAVRRDILVHCRRMTN